MGFKNKTVWIIGASSGIGRALSFDFAKKESKIVLSARNIDALEKVKQECLLHTTNCCIIPFDLERADNSQEVVEKVIQKFKTIDYLILSGGISQRSLIAETPISIDRKLMEVNFLGNIVLTKAVLPKMLSQKHGHITVISSIVGKFGFPLRSAYSASKHALHGFFETLRAEHYADNIKVMLVIPGRVKTNISFNALQADGTSHQKLDKGQANGISAESCSIQILKAIERDKKEVLIGGKELLLVYIKKYIPFFYYRLTNKEASK